MTSGVSSVLKSSFSPQSLVLIREDFCGEVDNVLCITPCIFKLNQQCVSKMLERLIHS